MNINVDVHIHPPDGKVLSEVRTLLQNILHLTKAQGDQVMADLSALTAQVESNTSVVASAVELIGGLRQAIIDAGTDPQKLQELTDKLATSDAALAAALVANT